MICLRINQNRVEYIALQVRTARSFSIQLGDETTVRLCTKESNEAFPKMKTNPDRQQPLLLC